MAISNITLTGSVSLMPAWNATDGTASFGGTDIAAYQYLKEFTNGSGANQINEIYRKRRNVSAVTTSDTFNITALQDPFGYTFAFTKV